jgi:iron complex outermembrane receptor protein
LHQYYQINQREEFENVADPSEQEIYFKLKTFTYTLYYYLPEYEHWETSIGVNGMSQNNENLGEEFLIPEYNLFDFGIYLLTQKKFDNFMVSGGIRFDNRYIDSRQLIINEAGVTDEKFSAFTKTFNNLSGSIGASYRPNEVWNFKLNLARGFRAPTIAELSSNGRHEGSFRYEYGNLNLNPETSLQADIGIEIETEHSTIQLAAFFNHIDNYIYLQKLLDSNGNDSIPDPTDGSIAFQYVQGAANLYGFEAGIDLHPHPFHWLHFENTISLVYTKQLNQPDSSKYLPFIPPPKFKSELRANLPTKDQLFSENFIKLEWVYHFEQNRIFTAYDTETITPDYSLINAGAGTTLKNSKGIEILSLVLLANNILDLSYQSHLSRLKYAPDNPATSRAGVFNMGRNFVVKVRVPIRLK